MKAVWEPNGEQWDYKMLWAACCLCFFAFMRAGELTVPSDDSFDPSVHLCVSDISVDHPSRPSMIKVKIKQSKTDPFRKGVDLFVGTASDALCPVAAVLAYIAVRGTDAGPLFRFQDGRFLTRNSHFVSIKIGRMKLWHCVQSLGAQSKLSSCGKHSHAFYVVSRAAAAGTIMVYSVFFCTKVSCYTMIDMTTLTIQSHTA